MAKLAARHLPKLKIRSTNNYKHVEEEQILEVLVVLAEGNRISKLTWVKVFKEDDDSRSSCILQGCSNRTQREIFNAAKIATWMDHCLARYERK